MIAAENQIEESSGSGPIAPVTCKDSYSIYDEANKPLDCFIEIFRRARTKSHRSFNFHQSPKTQHPCGKLLDPALTFKTAQIM